MGCGSGCARGSVEGAEGVRPGMGFTWGADEVRVGLLRTLEECDNIKIRLFELDHVHWQSCQGAEAERGFGWIQFRSARRLPQRLRNGADGVRIGVRPRVGGGCGWGAGQGAPTGRWRVTVRMGCGSGCARG